MEYNYIDEFTVEPGDEAEDFFPIIYKVYIEDSMGYTHADDMDIIYEDLYELRDVFNIANLIDNPERLIDIIDDMDAEAIDEIDDAFKELSQEGYNIPQYRIIREDGYSREQIIFEKENEIELSADRMYRDTH